MGTAAEKGPFAGVRVLVVDDEEDSRLFLKTLLEDEGAKVTTVSGGDEAIALVREDSFDLMTLDLSMPGRNGVEVFGEIRGSSQTNDLPICIVTGHAELRALVYDRAAPPPEGFMTKPVDPEPLLDTLRRILALRQRRSRR